MLTTSAYFMKAGQKQDHSKEKDKFGVQKEIFVTG